MVKHFFFLLDEAGEAGGGGGAGAGSSAGATSGGASSGGGSAEVASASSAPPPAGESTASASANASGATAGNGGAGSAAAWLKDDFSFAEGWQNQLPDEKFGEFKATLANFRDLPSLAKGLKDSMTAARAKTEGMVRIPGADAKPEELAAYRKAVGIPESPEGYGLKAPDKLPDGVTWNPEHAASFTKLAHQLGLTPAQAAKLSDWQMNLTAQGHEQMLQRLQSDAQTQDDAIRQAFGSNLEPRLVMAKRVGQTFFGNPEGPKTYSELVLGLAKIADAMSEDKLLSGEQVANKLGPEAMASEIMRDPKSPYNNPKDPRHREQVAQVNDLMKRAYPSA